MARPRDKAEIVRRLKMVRPDCRRKWGRMSAHQMVCHLSDSFRMVTRQKATSPATGVLQSTLIKWIALYAPLPWPAGVPTRPEVDQEVGGTSPGDFAADLAELELLLGTVTTPVNAIFAGRRIRSSDRCPKPRGYGGLICTQTITFASLGC